MRLLALVCLLALCSAQRDNDDRKELIMLEIESLVDETSTKEKRSTEPRAVYGASPGQYVVRSRGGGPLLKQRPLQEPQAQVPPEYLEFLQQLVGDPNQVEGEAAQQPQLHRAQTLQQIVVTSREPQPTAARYTSSPAPPQLVSEDGSLLAPGQQYYAQQPPQQLRVNPPQQRLQAAPTPATAVLQQGAAFLHPSRAHSVHEARLRASLAGNDPNFAVQLLGQQAAAGPHPGSPADPSLEQQLTRLVAAAQAEEQQLAALAQQQQLSAGSPHRLAQQQQIVAQQRQQLTPQQHQQLASQQQQQLAAQRQQQLAAQQQQQRLDVVQQQQLAAAQQQQALEAEQQQQLAAVQQKQRLEAAQQQQLAAAQQKQRLEAAQQQQLAEAQQKQRLEEAQAQQLAAAQQQQHLEAVQQQQLAAAQQRQHAAAQQQRQHAAAKQQRQQAAAQQRQQLEAAQQQQLAAAQQQLQEQYSQEPQQFSPQQQRVVHIQGQQQRLVQLQPQQHQLQAIQQQRLLQAQPAAELAEIQVQQLAQDPRLVQSYAPQELQAQQFPQEQQQVAQPQPQFLIRVPPQTAEQQYDVQQYSPVQTEAAPVPVRPASTLKIPSSATFLTERPASRRPGQYHREVQVRGRTRARGQPRLRPEQPVYEPVQQTLRPEQPVYEPVQQALRPEQPVYEPVQQTLRPEQPVYEPVQQTLRPEPVQPKSAPVAEDDEYVSALLSQAGGRGIFSGSNKPSAALDAIKATTALPPTGSRSSIFVSTTSTLKKPQNHGISVEDLQSFGDTDDSKPLPEVHLPTPKGQRPLTQSELRSLLAAGFSVTPVIPSGNQDLTLGLESATPSYYQQSAKRQRSYATPGPPPSQDVYQPEQTKVPQVQEEYQYAEPAAVVESAPPAPRFGPIIIPEDPASDAQADQQPRRRPQARRGYTRTRNSYRQPQQEQELVPQYSAGYDNIPDASSFGARGQSRIRSRRPQQQVE